MRYLGENSARIFETRDLNLNFDSSYTINKIVILFHLLMSSFISDGRLWLIIGYNALTVEYETDISHDKTPYLNFC